MHHPMTAPTPPGQAERWLSVEELADHMQLTPDTVRRLARNGTLPSLKVGRQFRFLVSSVVEKLEGRAVDTARASEKENPRSGGF